MKNLFKSTQNSVKKPKKVDNSFFGFLFKHLEILLLIGMFGLVASIYFSFVEYISKSSTFIAEERARFNFATRLILGLMFVEVLLALATSYFRGQKEWFKSILVTVGAFVITYYNHLTIIELFEDFAQKMPFGSDAVQTKMLLANWFIFALGEIIGLLMHSKKDNESETIEEKILTKLDNLQLPNFQGPGNQAPSEKVNPNPQTFFAQTQSEPSPSTNTIVSENENPPIGFVPNSPKSESNNDKDFNEKVNKLLTRLGLLDDQKEVEKKPRNIPKRGKSIDYKKMHGLIEKGLKPSEIAKIMNCSEASVFKYKRQNF